MSTLILTTKEEKSGFINFWGINAVKATRLESGAVPISHFVRTLLYTHISFVLFFICFFLPDDLIPVGYSCVSIREYMEPNDILVWLGKIAAGLSASTAIFLFMKKAITTFKSLFKLTEKIDLIYSEFKTNSGKSLKDQLNNIETNIKKNSEMTTNIFSRVRWMFDHRDEPIFEADSSGNYTWVNEAFLKLAKRPSSEIIGTGWKNVISEKTRHNLVESWNCAIAENRDFEEEYLIANKQGQTFKANCVANKTPDGYIGTLFNIQEITN